MKTNEIKLIDQILESKLFLGGVDVTANTMSVQVETIDSTIESGDNQQMVPKEVFSFLKSLSVDYYLTSTEYDFGWIYRICFDRQQFEIGEIIDKY